MRKSFVLVTLAVVFLSAGLLLAQQWHRIAVVATDTYSGESLVPVKWLDGQTATPDYRIKFESRDGYAQETGVVEGVYGGYLTLVEPLKHDYPQGSQVYQ